MNENIKITEQDKAVALSKLLGNRAIKIRAWDINAKQFVPDVLIAANRYGFIYRNMDGCEFIGEDRKIILTLYTGINDRTGKMIYEGDIVKDKYGCKMIILFYEQWGSLAAYHIAKNPERDIWLQLDQQRWQYEIIGNAFENLKLLNEVA